MTYERKVNHVETGLSNRSSAYHTTSFAQLMIPVLEEVKALEDRKWQIFESRFIDGATGHALDMLGEYVGEPDQGDSESDHKVRIAMKLLAYLSRKGRRANYNRLLELLTGSSWFLSEAPGWAIFTQNDSNLYASAPLARLLEAASADGVLIRLCSNEAASDPFDWPSQDGSVAGGEWKAADATIAGNDWQGVQYP